MVSLGHAEQCHSTRCACPLGDWDAASVIRYMFATGAKVGAQLLRFDAAGLRSGQEQLLRSSSTRARRDGKRDPPASHRILECGGADHAG